MKINFLTVGDLNAASSRLRCFYLGDSLSSYGFDIVYNQAPTNEDLLFVQKKIDINILNHARLIKEKGGFVLYDIDDEGEGLAWLNIDPEIRNKFLNTCDFLSVNTSYRLKNIDRNDLLHNIPHKFASSEPIDYIKKSINFKKEKNTAKKGCWFGNAINFKYTQPYISLLSQLNWLKFDVITSHQYIPILNKYYNDLNLIEWNLNSFPEIMKNYDFTVLIHNNDKEGNSKSNNKMIFSLAMGIPPFVSNTESYAITAKEINMEELIVRTPQELISKLSDEKFMESIYRKILSTNCTNYLMNHDQEIITKKFINNLMENTIIKKIITDNPFIALSIKNA
jgi:hypothetical protein